MYCTRCGVELAEGDRFCSQCGQQVEGVAPDPADSYHPPRLALDVENKKIAGVCAGFARYLDIDVTLVRIIWLSIALGTGVGFIAYLVAWIAMPKYRPPATTTALAGQNG